MFARQQTQNILHDCVNPKLTWCDWALSALPIFFSADLTPSQAVCYRSVWPVGNHCMSAAECNTSGKIFSVGCSAICQVFALSAMNLRFIHYHSNSCTKLYSTVKTLSDGAEPKSKHYEYFHLTMTRQDQLLFEINLRAALSVFVLCRTGIKPNYLSSWYPRP